MISVKEKRLKKIFEKKKKNNYLQVKSVATNLAKGRVNFSTNTYHERVKSYTVTGHVANVSRLNVVC